MNPTDFAPPRFEDGKPLRIAGIQMRYTHANRHEIPQQWMRFGPHIGQVPGQDGDCTYGVSWDFDGVDAFSYLCGVEVAETKGLPEDFAVLDIAPQHYAVFTHVGAAQTIPGAFEAIWGHWLPSSGKTAAPAPCLERYFADYCPDSADSKMEIWIPIQD